MIDSYILYDLKSGKVVTCMMFIFLTVIHWYIYTVNIYTVKPRKFEVRFFEILANSKKILDLMLSESGDYL